MPEAPIPKLPWNIYWINLDRRPDRKEHMEEILLNNKENSFRIQAVDFKNNFYPYNVIQHPKLNGGEHGCTCSHIKALVFFLENSSDEYCFIAEDDLSNNYSQYWHDKHYELLKNGDYEILQLQTTTDRFNNNELIPEKKSDSGATIYKIKRNIAEVIVKNHFHQETLTIDLSNHIHPVADHLIWTYGNTYLLPMFTYLNVTDSDTNKEGNNNMNNYWQTFFQNAKDKYLTMWCNNKLVKNNF
jgi:GR25 family glycosyltransferase involved in LPS biosynthesis